MFKRAFNKRHRSTLGPNAAAGNAFNSAHDTHGVPASVGLELLFTLPVRFFAAVYVPRFRVRQVGRHLEIRGNHAMLLKRSSSSSTSAPSPSDILSLFELPPASSARVVTPQTVVLTLPPLTLTFQSAPEAQAFLAMMPTKPPSSPPPQLQPHLLCDLDLLGQGATATVRRLSADTAVKLIPKDRVFDSEHDLNQLIAERHAYSVMRSSPYILKLRAAWQTKNHFAFVTDLAHYGDLHHVQLQLPQRRFPVHIARHLFAELVVALDGIHSKGWLYRDMKPSNVLLTQDGHIRLADLGLMKRVNTEKGSTLSLSSMSSAASTDDDTDTTDDDLERPEQPRLIAASSFVGTRRFMSPEVYGHPGRKRAYSVGADVWSLGVTLYVLLTGRFPFDGGESDPATLSLSVRHDQIDVSGIDPQAADLIQVMLHKDPLERASLADVKRHPWLEHVSWSSVRISGVVQSPAPDVVNFLRECGVLHVDERHAMRVESDANGFSQVSDLPGKNCSAAETDWELLSFEYTGQ